MIREFQGEYRWLSNFAMVRLRLGNKWYMSVEHAYMSMKTLDESWKITCSEETNLKPSHVKRLSKNITLREDWDNIKLKVMTDLVSMKFNNSIYRDKLLATGNQNIQEGNFWNDKFWGICLKTNEGENHLGRLIMNIRDELRESS